MPTVDDVCTALASACSEVTGLRAKGWIDDNINPPEAHVFTLEHDPRMVFTSPIRTFPMGVQVMVARADPRAGQKALRGFMEPSGSTSVRAALEDSSNWPSGVHDVTVTRIGQPFELVIEAQQAGGMVTERYLAVQFDVEVIW